MIRAWHHYTTWEDWRAGMYGDSLPGLPSDAARLLGDPDEFDRVARSVVDEWPIAASQHLTDTSCNRRAWIGQASCCFALQCTREATVIGWFTLPLASQARANAVATGIIREWERRWDRAETLFG